jgi:hypothetical protein
VAKQTSVLPIQLNANFPKPKKGEKSCFFCGGEGVDLSVVDFSVEQPFWLDKRRVIWDIRKLAGSLTQITFRGSV